MMFLRMSKNWIVYAGCIFLSACTHKPSSLPPASPITPVSHLQKNSPMGLLNIQIIAIQKHYRIIIPTDNIFNLHTSHIRETAYPALIDLRSFLKSFMPVKINVYAYTDNLGSVAEDQKLTELQAKSLIGFFWQQGLSYHCFVPQGFGKHEDYTIASNRSIHGSLANRRIELTFNR